MSEEEMLDERFSKTAFEAYGWNSEESRLLCGELDAVIHEQLLKILKPAMIEIVNQLNAMGHALVDVSDDMGDAIHYREPLEPSLGSGYKMIVAVDLTLTVGYPRSQRLPIN